MGSSSVSLHALLWVIVIGLSGVKIMDSVVIGCGLHHQAYVCSSIGGNDAAPASPSLHQWFSFAPHDREQIHSKNATREVDIRGGLWVICSNGAYS